MPVNGEAAAVRNRRADREAEADFRGKFDKLFKPTGDAELRKLGELRREFDKRAFEVAENKRLVAGAKFAKIEQLIARIERGRARAGLPDLSTAGDDAGETYLDLRKLREKN